MQGNCKKGSVFKKTKQMEKSGKNHQKEVFRHFTGRLWHFY